MSTLVNKHKAAEDAWQNYDFGDLRVSDSEGFDTSDALDYTRIAYLEDDTDGSIRVSFHVRFSEQGEVIEVYALDVGTGNYIGTDPIVHAQVGDKVWHIDTRRLSRDRGYVIVTAEFGDRGTEYLLTTDVMAAIKRVREAGGKVVDATTDFEEVINSQYDGIAVLSTTMGAEG